MWVWKGKELKTLEDALWAAMAIDTPQEGRRFLYAWLEEAPDLTEEKILGNLCVMLAMACSNEGPTPEYAHREFHRHLSYFMVGGGECKHGAEPPGEFEGGGESDERHEM